MLPDESLGFTTGGGGDDGLGVSSVLKMSDINLSKEESWAPQENMHRHITRQFSNIIFLESKIKSCSLHIYIIKVRKLTYSRKEMKMKVSKVSKARVLVI